MKGRQLWMAGLATGALVLALLAACGGNTPQAAGEPSPAQAGDRVRVVATTSIVGDVVSRVGGEMIDLTTLMGPGVDPHSYVPSPSDTAVVHDADVIFANGLDLEASLEKMIESASGGATEVHLSDSLVARPGQGANLGAGHDHSGADPHVWFDVHNVQDWVTAIRDTLSSLDPANAAGYAANAEAYNAQLEELDTWIVEQVAQVPPANRKLVTNHPSFGYFADRYGFEQVGTVYPVNPSAEPSARDIAALEDAIRQHDVPAVFTESTVNPRLAEQVAQDTGVQLVQLYTGALGEPGSGAATYIDMMRYDVTAIVDALK